MRIVYKLCICSKADIKPGTCGRSACNALALLLWAGVAMGAGADLVTLLPTFLLACLPTAVMLVLPLAKLFFLDLQLTYFLLPLLHYVYYVFLFAGGHCKHSNTYEFLSMYLVIFVFVGLAIRLFFLVEVFLGLAM